MKTRRGRRLAGFVAVALLALAGCRSRETVKSGGSIEQAKAVPANSGVQQAVAKVSQADGTTWPGLEPASSSGGGCSH